MYDEDDETTKRRLLAIFDAFPTLLIDVHKIYTYLYTSE